MAPGPPAGLPRGGEVPKQGWQRTDGSVLELHMCVHACVGCTFSEHGHGLLRVVGS